MSDESQFIADLFATNSILRDVSGGLSIVGSIAILVIYFAYPDLRSNTRKILTIMSFFDLLCALAYNLPTGSGNHTRLCEIQSICLLFISQATSIWPVCYLFSTAIYYTAMFAWYLHREACSLECQNTSESEFPIIRYASVTFLWCCVIGVLTALFEHDVSFQLPAWCLGKSSTDLIYMAYIPLWSAWAINVIFYFRTYSRIDKLQSIHLADLQEKNYDKFRPTSHSSLASSSSSSHTPLMSIQRSNSLEADSAGPSVQSPVSMTPRLHLYPSSTAPSYQLSEEELAEARQKHERLVQMSRKLIAVPVILILQRVPGSVVRMLQVFRPQDRTLRELGSLGSVLWHLQAFFDPSQGLFNFILFTYMSHSVSERVARTFRHFWDQYMCCALPFWCICCSKSAGLSSMADDDGLQESLNSQGLPSDDVLLNSRDPLAQIGNVSSSS